MPYLELLTGEIVLIIGILGYIAIRNYRFVEREIRRSLSHSFTLDRVRLA